MLLIKSCPLLSLPPSHTSLTCVLLTSSLPLSSIALFMLSTFSPYLTSSILPSLLLHSSFLLPSYFIWLLNTLMHLPFLLPSPSSPSVSFPSFLSVTSPLVAFLYSITPSLSVTPFSSFHRIPPSSSHPNALLPLSHLPSSHLSFPNVHLFSLCPLPIRPPKAAPFSSLLSSFFPETNTQVFPPSLLSLAPSEQHFFPFPLVP